MVMEKFRSMPGLIDPTNNRNYFKKVRFADSDNVSQAANIIKEEKPVESINTEKSELGNKMPDIKKISTKNQYNNELKKIVSKLKLEFELHNYITSKFEYLNSFDRYKDSAYNVTFVVLVKTDKQNILLEISGLDENVVGTPYLNSPKKITHTSYFAFIGYSTFLFLIIILLITGSN